MSTLNSYSPAEEKWNIRTHAFGLVLSLLGTFLLLRHAIRDGEFLHILTFGLFGMGLVTLYLASTFYHSSSNLKLRRKLKILDHASIYILIASSYTPFALNTIGGKLGWNIFIGSWSMALLGVLIKIFSAGKYKGLSTLLYVLMGWAIVFAIEALLAKLPPLGIRWLFAGGLAYTAGAILYSFKQIPYNHALFHVFVLMGSYCHFHAVYFYVLS